MSILCSLSNINLVLGLKTIFQGAELTINQGDRLGLIGLNGQGKSTLFKILTGAMSPDTSTPPFMYNKSSTSFDIFLVPQELNIQDFKNFTIENYYLAFYPKLHSIHTELEFIEKELSHAEHFEKLLSRQEKLIHDFGELKGWDIQNKYVNYLKQFDLHDLNRKVEFLSGGEKRKMALSVGLSTTAELILWDEPTNHLDIQTIELFEEELMNSDKTFMIISHDRYLLNNTTDRILHIQRGKINSFKGTYLDYLEYLEQKREEMKETLSRMGNKHRRELAWMRQGIKARGTRSKKRVEGFHKITADIADLKSRAIKNVDLSLMHSGRKSKVLATIENGFFSYQDKKVFENLNLMLTKKDKVALMGPNGAGKTTLINLFRQKEKLQSGVQKMAQDLKIVVFDQNRESLDENKTPLQVVGDGNMFITLKEGQQKHVYAYLEDFLFTDDQLNRPISTLSGGEKNRLQLALFMKQAADLWVFDEPTNDLDIETIELLERELKSYEAAVVIISHDRAFLDNVCDTTWLINDHKIELFTGGYSQIAPYLEALALEKSLQKPTPEKSIAPIPVTEKKTLTQKEKRRLATIETEITKAEETIELCDTKLATYDFAQMSKEKQNEYNNLVMQKKEQEKILETLLNEWEVLSAKENES